MAELFGQRFDQHTDDVIDVTNLLKELADREGKHVWKKYTLPVTITMVQQNTSANPITFQMASTDVDLSKVDVAFFNGITGIYNVSGTTAPFSIKDDGLYMGDALRGALTYNASTQVLSCAGSIGSLCTWTCDEIKEFLDYVVSDDPTAYPDGAEQDGYWYEKVEGIPVDEAVIAETLGCSKIAIDKYTPTANGAFTNIPHSLGEVPSLVIVIAHALHPANGGLWRTFHCSDINGGSFYASSSDKPTMTIYYRANYSKYSVSNDNLTKTASTITNPGTYVGAGIEYTIITGV